MAAIPRKQQTTFNLTDTNIETTEVYLGLGGTSVGFFAWISFDASVSATVRVHLGPTADKTTVIPALDMVVTDAGPHTFDVATRAKYMKLEIVSGGTFDADVVISRN